MPSEKQVPNEKDVAYLKASDVSVIANEWFQILYGRIMTIIEAGMPDGSQCEAVKSLAGQAVWTTYNEMWDNLTHRYTTE